MQSEEYWEQRATELSRTSLDTVRASATAWAATTAALFGVFGGLGLASAPDAIAELGEPARTSVAVLVVVATLSGVTSILLTGYASRGPVTRVTPLTGLKLAAWTRARTAKAHHSLRWGQLTGVVAALLLLAAGLVSVLDASAPASEETLLYLVRTDDGAVECGTLVRRASGLVLEGGGGEELLDLSSGVARVLSVPTCPDEAP